MKVEDNYKVTNNEISHTGKREIRSKRQYIINYKTNNSSSKASEIAEKIGTSVGYVYNVLSRSKKIVSSERQGSNRSNGLLCGHGLAFYEDGVPHDWYDRLQVPVVNLRTGMKQVGFKKNGDPCTCQVHKNGRIIIFPHDLSWKEWLIDRLIDSGWNSDQAQLLIMNLNYRLKVAEAGVKVPEGFLPKNLCLKTEWGVVVVKDDSPTKNTLELKLSVPDLKRFLGLPEINQKLQMLTQGTMAYNQLVRALIPMLSRLNSRLEKDSGQESS